MTTRPPPSFACTSHIDRATIVSYIKKFHSPLPDCAIHGLSQKIGLKLHFNNYKAGIQSLQPSFRPSIPHFESLCTAFITALTNEQFENQYFCTAEAPACAGCHNRHGRSPPCGRPFRDVDGNRSQHGHQSCKVTCNAAIAAACSLRAPIQIKFTSAATLLRRTIHQNGCQNLTQPDCAQPG